MGKIENATQWMIDLANDDTHGYDQANRWGPDYDCSSAVITAWQNAGVPVKTNGAGATSSMYTPFISSGFADVTSTITLSSGKGLAYGDVLLKPGSHTAMYIGSNQIVHASINEKGTTTGGQTGDQTGKEICIRSYYNKPWTYVLRYNGTGDGGGSTGDSTIRKFQTWLNNNYSSGITVDGIYGSRTKTAATKAYQKVLGVTADGAFGASSKAAVKTLKPGSNGNAVYLLQGMLYCRGFSPNGVDGVFGSGTTAAVKKFQSSKGLTSDGLAGANTMYALYN